MLEHARRHCMSAKVKVTISVYQLIGQVGETGGNCNIFQIFAHYVEHVFY